ncbi:MAG: hypothetical protein JNL96_12190 [Planctomycetaceae bacterium]|nr:hypothetical protein [Planctomycetaceae bacterium]
MKLGTLVAACLSIGFALISTSGRTDEPNKTAGFMRLKLAHSQQLLEGLALNDARMVEKNAQALSTLTRDEMWQVLQTPEYLQYSVDFRKAADAVAAAAGKQNLDGAVLAYMGLTMQCVECHKHVRDVRMASYDRRNSIPRLADR